MGRLPEYAAVSLSDVCFVVAEEPHPFEAEHLEAINRNWEEEVKAKPRLFDGRVAMFGAHDISGGRLTAVCRPVRFATFLYWRKIQPVEGAEHFFAHAVLVARDNALVAVRMGAHTANSGQVYFAAGSFDPSDFSGERIDVEGNMAREVMEETGIDLNGATAEAGFSAWRFGGNAVVFRRYYFDLDPEVMAERIQYHVNCDPDPEIDCAVIIRKGCELPDGLTSYMPGIIGWHFGKETSV